MTSPLTRRRLRGGGGQVPYLAGEDRPGSGAKRIVPDMTEPRAAATML